MVTLPGTGYDWVSVEEAFRTTMVACLVTAAAVFSTTAALFTAIFWPRKEVSCADRRRTARNAGLDR